MSSIIATLSYVSYPLLLLLRGFLAVLLVPTIPLLYVVRHLFYAVRWQFHFLAKFETLYIFFGVAIFMGVCTGALLHYTTDLIGKQLDLNRPAIESGRTRPSRRVERSRKQTSKGQYRMTKLDTHTVLSDGRMDTYADWLKRDTRLGKRGLLSTTILEEDDSS